MRTKIKVISELRQANQKNVEARSRVVELRSAGKNGEEIQAAMQNAFDCASKVEELRSELLEIEDQEITDDLIAKGANEKAHEDKSGKRKTAEYRRAFSNYLRSSNFSDLSQEDRKALSEMRALNVGSSSEGGFVVDTETLTTLQQEKITWGALYSMTNKIRTKL